LLGGPGDSAPSSRLALPGGPRPSSSDRIADHDAIVALATGGRAQRIERFWFDEIPDERIDTDAPPETTPLVLDADASQRACIAAAVEGRSFVMDGPPGTGKSQTIANIIGALLHAGKSVLFVSEKAAALEVVRNRLTETGLDGYLLELHSHKATRKEVAVALGQALDNLTVPPAPMGDLRVPARLKRHQSRRALAVSSGPLSQRTNRGAVPRSTTKRSRTLTVASASIRRSTAMVRALAGVLIHDVEQLEDPPVGVWSNW
jgi:AAA domain